MTIRGLAIPAAVAVSSWPLSLLRSRNNLRTITMRPEDVGMMYAIGKGVQQDCHEAGKWFLTAAEAGNTRAAANYVGSLRGGLGNLRRDPELSAHWAKFLLAHPEHSPVPGQ